MKRILTITLLILFAVFAFYSTVSGDSFDFYFSNTGHDAMGAGTEAEPWKSLYKAQWAIETYASSTNTVTLYFNRVD